MEKIKNFWTGFKEKYLAFELWLGGFLIGLKVKIAAGMSALGSGLLWFASQMDGVDFTKVFVGRVAIVGFFLAMLTLYARRLSNKAP